MDWSVVWNYRNVYLQGLEMTLKVSIMATLIAIGIGVVMAIFRLSRFKPLSMLAYGYVEVIRNTPLLVQLFVIYFGLGSIIDYKTEFWPAVAGLAIFAGSYVTEIVRAGIQSIPRGQREAALSVGMTGNQALRLIVLPQAFTRILPPLAGQFITLIKDSSLVSFLALTDITFAARKIMASTFRPLEVYLAAAALYFMLTGTLSQFVAFLERRTARSAGRS
jgi:polar amino acid transport system permease protein